MNPLDVMQAVFALLAANRPEGVKTIFDPGRPMGPFHASLPAIVILTGDPAENREYDTEDLETRTYKIEVHLFTQDPFARAEQRVRGSYDQLYPLLSDVADIIASARAVGGMDELVEMGISDTGPGHGVVSLTYVVRQSR